MRTHNETTAIRARTILALAIAHCEIQRPEVCSKCGRPDRTGRAISAHHEDYSKPLDVIWLCHKCHMSIPKGILVRDTGMAYVGALVPIKLKKAFVAKAQQEGRSVAKQLERLIESGIRLDVAGDEITNQK